MTRTLTVDSTKIDQVPSRDLSPLSSDKYDVEVEPSGFLLHSLHKRKELSLVL
jgi:hypothetical protein